MGNIFLEPVVKVWVKPSVYLHYCDPSSLISVHTLHIDTQSLSTTETSMIDQVTLAATCIPKSITHHIMSESRVAGLCVDQSAGSSPLLGACMQVTAQSAVYTQATFPAQSAKPMVRDRDEGCKEVPSGPAKQMHTQWEQIPGSLSVVEALLRGAHSPAGQASRTWQPLLREHCSAPRPYPNSKLCFTILSLTSMCVSLAGTVRKVLPRTSYRTGCMQDLQADHMLAAFLLRVH